MSTPPETAPASGPGPVGVEPPHKLLPPAVLQRWLHAHEEDADGVEVYKPYGTPLPPSRGRDGFEMRQDGRFIQDVIGAGRRPRPATAGPAPESGRVPDTAISMSAEPTGRN